MRLSWPLPPECNRITQAFAERPAFDPDYYAQWGYPGHPALDITCPIGTEVYAAHTGWTEPRWNAILGEHVYVHTDDSSMMTRYSHLSRIDVRYGQRIREGERLGLSGNTGRATGPHLDLALKITGVSNLEYNGWLNAEDYLRRKTVTKTSAHIQRIEPWMQQALIDLRCNWVKFVNAPPGPDPMARIPNKIVRIWTDAIDDQFVPRGEQGGRDFVRHMLPQWRERPWATCYSLANEPGCNTPTQLDNLCAYSIGAMEEAFLNGIKLVIFDTPESNPSGGNPYSYEVKRDKLARLVPAVRMATELGHYIGTHAYWRPGIEGPLGEFHALGEVVLKHDIWQLLGAYSAEPKFLVTEWGLDGALESNPHEGWRTFVGRGEITERDYVDGLLAAEALAQGKPWLKGLFTFTWGYEGQWQSYDHYEGFVRNLVAAMPNLPVVEPPLLPPSVPDEPTLDDVRWAREALRSWPATMKDARLHGEEWIMQDPDNPWRYISRNRTSDVYYVVTLNPQTWERVRATPLGQTSDLL